MFFISSFVALLLASASVNAAPAGNSSMSESLESRGETFTGGFATYYLQGGAAGACGAKHSDNDLIAAIDERRYGDSGKKSKLCGKKVKITNTKNKKTVTVTIADDCPTCENQNSIDLSKGAFTKIATIEEGMVPISWTFL